MECTECHSEIEADSSFCSKCRAPVAGAPPSRPDRGGADDELDDDELDDDGRDDDAPEEGGDGDHAADVGHAAPSASGVGAKIAGVISLVALVAVGLLKLTNRPAVRIETIDLPDPGYGAGAARAVIPRDSAPERAPTESERAVAGTWVATVGFDAPRPAAFGATMVQIEALRAGLAELNQRCVWLELYPNLRGFQHACSVVDGEPSVLERTDPLTGRSSPLGVAFRWSFEGATLSLTYDEEMVVSAAERTTRFVRTAFALPAGSAPFDAQQSFPEHPDVPPLAARFEVFPGSYLGDEP